MKVLSVWAIVSFEVARIQRFEVFRNELAVSTDQLVVEPYLASAVLWALDQYHVPVYSRAVAVIALLVRLARCEMQRSGDLFVEQNIAHWLLNVRIETKGELADKACSRVGVQNLVEPFGVVCGGIDDFAILELEPHILKPRAGVERGSVVL